MTITSPRLLLIPLLFLCCSCGSQRTSVEPGSAPFIYKSPAITVSWDTSRNNASLDSGYRMQFDKELKHTLASKGFSEGSGLQLKYWFAAASAGSRFSRILANGWGWGTGTIQIGAEFYDPTGRKLSSTSSIGDVTGGFFGGSYSEAITRTADSLSDYAHNVYFGSATPPRHGSPVSQSPQPNSVPVDGIVPPTSIGAAATPEPSPAPGVAVVPTTPAATVPAAVATPIPAPGLQVWQLAINTTPPGAIIQAYDRNQNLYRVGQSPTGFLWPLITQNDVIVIFFQGRQVSVIPNFNESLIIDFAKVPPDVKGGTVISTGRN